MKLLSIKIRVAVVMTVMCCLGARLNAAEIITYHLRSDEEPDFSVNDKREAGFWTDSVWKSRPVCTVNCVRILPNGKNDGNVKITIKAVATISAVYLIFYFDYDRKAPTSTSLDVPLDGLSLMVSRFAFGLSSALAYYRLLVHLTPDSGGIGCCDVNQSTSCGDCNGICAEFIGRDSMSKTLEVKIPCKNIYLDPPNAGACKALDLRYLPSAAGVLNTKNPFTANDSVAAPERFFLGELTMEPHFDDSIYCFTSPRSSTTLIAGAFHTITWGTTVQGGIVELDYSPDNGSTWNILTAATINDGAHAWQLPFSYSNSYQVRMKIGDKVFAASESFSVGCPVPTLFRVPDSVALLFFQWLSVENATSYRILIDTVSSFAIPIIDDTVGATSFSPSRPLPAAKVYWKVASDLNYGSFSGVDSFVNTGSSAIASAPKRPFGNHSERRRREANKIIYSVMSPGRIDIELFNMSGRIIRILESGYRHPGTYEIRLGDRHWNPGSGTYVLRFTSGKHSETIPFSRLH